MACPSRPMIPAWRTTSRSEYRRLAKTAHDAGRLWFTGRTVLGEACAPVVKRVAPPHDGKQHQVIGRETTTVDPKWRRACRQLGG